MANFVGYYIPQFGSSSLNVPGGITAVQTSGITLNSVPSDIDITKPGIICIDYSNPINTDNAEWITYTSIDGTNTLQGVARGQEGFTAKIHANGASVAWVVSKSHVNQVSDALTGVTLGVGLNQPKVTTSVNDSNNNEVIKTPATTSAVNEITITNAATGNAPQVSATGDDSNIDLQLAAKGSGKVKINSSYGDITSDADGATVTFNLATTNFHTVILGGNRTLALSNESVGQRFAIELVQDGTGSRTVTWFSYGTTFTADSTTDILTVGRNIPTGTPFTVANSGGALPTGLSAATTYYAINVSTTTIKAATSFANAQAGTAIDITANGSGTNTLYTQIRWAGQTAPTLSTGKNTRDCFAFYIADTGIYIGTVVVQNA